VRAAARAVRPRRCGGSRIASAAARAKGRRRSPPGVGPARCRRYRGPPDPPPVPTPLLRERIPPRLAACAGRIEKDERGGDDAGAGQCRSTACGRQSQRVPAVEGNARPATSTYITKQPKHRLCAASETPKKTRTATTPPAATRRQYRLLVVASLDHLAHLRAHVESHARRRVGHAQALAHGAPQQGGDACGLLVEGGAGPRRAERLADHVARIRRLRRGDVLHGAARRRPAGGARAGGTSSRAPQRLAEVLGQIVGAQRPCKLLDDRAVRRDEERLGTTRGAAIRPRR